MKIKYFYLVATSILLSACSTTKTTKKETKEDPIENVSLGGFTIQDTDESHQEIKEIPKFHASNKRINDLLHTKLEVKFDWTKQYLHGKAELTFKPFFYKTNQLVLDAKGMDIHSLKLNGKEAKYVYLAHKIYIDLEKYYTKDEQYKINIDYTAKPNELEAGGSAAITSEKGLYFINPLGEDPKKMPQIWTQGETQSSSCWFPTIDSPNEKTTQEIYITVKNKYITLSNGKLVSSTKNTDGTRTDYWKQDKRHTPYLFMMAIGEFKIVKDSWTRKDGSKMEVNYYVEKEYEQYAKDIFGKTPKMIQFFSDKLGVEFVWDKYSQIVVRDYVSGAMENTSATIHGDFLYRTDRELLDSDNESIIAHELFHHWFGDLVTCESWSHLTVNESFANYSQYLWDEFEHGKMEADKNGYGEMNGYFLSSAQSGYHNLVHYEYDGVMEMFDGHSYNKGGRILHMLRKYVGDEAFFLSLKDYLTKLKFETGEAHDLRLSFEKITGEDLNWFFNQWYFDKGHPTLEYTQNYNDSTKKLTVTIEQKQDFDKIPLFQLPIAIDIYPNENAIRKNVLVTKSKQSFTFEVEKPLLVNIDAEKIILGKKKDIKSESQWIYQLKHAPEYLDKKEAIAKLKSSKNTEAMKAIISMLDHPYYGVKNLAIKSLRNAIKEFPELVKPKLIKLTSDKKASVRNNSLRFLGKYFKETKELNSLVEKGLKDKSYAVMGTAMKLLAKENPKKAMEYAKELENDKNNSVQNMIAKIYSQNGTEENHDFFSNAILNASGFGKYGMLNSYKKFLRNLDAKDLKKSHEIYGNVAKNESTWWIKMVGYNGLIDTKGKYKNRISELETKLSTTDDMLKKSAIEREINFYRTAFNEVSEVYNTAKNNEKNPKILEYLGK